MWNDIRTDSTVDIILAKVPDNNTNYFKSNCGLPISPYFSAFKIKWLMHFVPQVKKAIKANKCLFGTVDTWLLWVRFFLYSILIGHNLENPQENEAQDILELKNCVINNANPESQYAKGFHQNQTSCGKTEQDWSNDNLSFTFKQLQFLLGFAFAMKIIKDQEQNKNNGTLSV